MNLLQAGPQTIEQLGELFIDSTVIYHSDEYLETVMWSYPEAFRLDRSDRWYRVDMGTDAYNLAQHCCPQGQALNVPVCSTCSPTQTHR